MFQKIKSCKEIGFNVKFVILGKNWRFVKGGWISPPRAFQGTKYNGPNSVKYVFRWDRQLGNLFHGTFYDLDLDLARLYDLGLDLDLESKIRSRS